MARSYRWVTTDKQDRVRYYRDKYPKMTNKDIAEAVGISASSVSRVLTGKLDSERKQAFETEIVPTPMLPQNQVEELLRSIQDEIRSINDTLKKFEEAQR